jgi:nitrogen-specific signal transduction histidine kinase/ABC-type phosphate/phosphonate transport system substrate-binding protein
VKLVAVLLFVVFCVFSNFFYAKEINVGLSLIDDITSEIEKNINLELETLLSKYGYNKINVISMLYYDQKRVALYNNEVDVLESGMGLYYEAYKHRKFEVMLHGCYIHNISGNLLYTSGIIICRREDDFSLEDIAKSKKIFAVSPHSQTGFYIQEKYLNDRNIEFSNPEFLRSHFEVEPKVLSTPGSVGFCGKFVEVDKENIKIIAETEKNPSSVISYRPDMETEIVKALDESIRRYYYSYAQQGRTQHFFVDAIDRDYTRYFPLSEKEKRRNRRHKIFNRFKTGIIIIGSIIIGVGIILGYRGYKKYRKKKKESFEKRELEIEKREFQLRERELIQKEIEMKQKEKQMEIEKEQFKIYEFMFGELKKQSADSIQDLQAMDLVAKIVIKDVLREENHRLKNQLTTDEMNILEKEIYDSVVYSTKVKILNFLNELPDYISIEKKDFTVEEVYNSIKNKFEHIPFSKAKSNKYVFSSLPMKYKSYKLEINVHRLNNIIDNLITNSSKVISRKKDEYRELMKGKFEGFIGINFDIQKEKNQEFLLISVSDNGGGFPEEILDKIYKEKVPSSKGDRNGEGSIFVQKFINHMGGSIKAENYEYKKEFKGAKTTISFPVHE